MILKRVHIARDSNSVTEMSFRVKCPNFLNSDISSNSMRLSDRCKKHIYETKFELFMSAAGIAQQNFG